MTRDHRFASLNGNCRKWLSDEHELEAVLEPDLEEPLDAEPAHDGWTPIVPRRPLARLGDVITIDPRRS